MPWTTKDYPNSWKNFSPEVREKAIEIANALMEEEGMMDSQAIPIATTRAKQWAFNRDLSVKDNPAEGEFAGEGRNVHLFCRSDGRWVVRKEDGKRASYVSRMKEKALAKAEKLAKNENSDLIIHGTDGKTVDHISYRLNASDDIHHVLKRKGMWLVQPESIGKPCYEFSTQEDAIEMAKKIARSQSSILVIHNAEGEIQERIDMRHQVHRSEHLQSG